MGDKLSNARSTVYIMTIISKPQEPKRDLMIQNWSTVDVGICVL